MKITVKTQRDFTQGQIEEIVNSSYGQSAPLIAERFGTSAGVIRAIIKKFRGKRYPWGARERD